jgi:hypothetical protein
MEIQDADMASVIGTSLLSASIMLTIKIVIKIIANGFSVGRLRSTDTRAGVSHD